MSTDITPVSGRLAAGVPLPDDGDDIDRASLVQFAQPLANGIEYTSTIADAFFNGGTVSVGGVLIFANGSPGDSIQVNGLYLFAGDENFLARFVGPVRGEAGCDFSGGPTRIGNVRIMPTTGDVTLEPLVHNFFYWPSSAASQTAHIAPSASYLEGMSFEVYLEDAAANPVLINNVDNTTAMITVHGITGTLPRHAKFIYANGGWRVLKGVKNANLYP